MRAVLYRGKGGPEVIVLADVPEPSYGTDDALVAVAYAGLNRADLLERMGRYGPMPRDGEVIPGLEFAGTVRAVGTNVTNVRPGQRVCGLVQSGAHAALVVANGLTLAAVPDGVELVEAAAIPEAFLTADDALFARGNLRLGERVLVHAAGSSVGLAALSLAKRAGAFTLGTSRTPHKLEGAHDFGMDTGVEMSEGWPERVRAACDGQGVDLVLDFIGAPALAGNIAVLANGGRIVSIGTLGGASAKLELGALMFKRATLIGTVLRTRPLEERIALARLLERRLLPLFAAGELHAEVDTVFPLDQIAEAHRAMESNDNFGKIVLAVGGP